MRFTHEVLFAESVRRGEFHRHDTDQYIFVHSGCNIIYTESESILIMVGDLVFIPAGIAHRSQTLTSTHCSLIRCEPQKAHPLGASTMGALSVSPLLREVFSLWGKEALPSDEKMLNCYQQVLFDQIQRCNLQPHELIAKGELDRRLLPIVEALAQQPSIKMTLAQFADSTGASVRTLNRLFQGHFGMSFQVIRQNIVMERARQLILGGHSATDISFLLGYSSLSAFSTAFNTYRQSVENPNL